MKKFKNSNKKSVRSFLLTSFASLLAIVMIIISISSFYKVKSQMNNLLDHKMQLAANIVEIGIKNKTLEESTEKAQQVVDKISLYFPNMSDHRQSIGLIVYDKVDNRLLLKTDNVSVNDYWRMISNNNTGFQEITTENSGKIQRWYTFTKESKNNTLITIFTSITAQENAYYSTIIELSITFLAIYIVLVILIFYIIKIALHPLESFSNLLAINDPKKREKIDELAIPEEIKAIVTQANKKITKLNYILEKEKRFSGDVAHELKRPITTLKMLVELTLLSKNNSEIQSNLKKIKNNTDRYAHIIDQLLILNRIGPDEEVVFHKKLSVNKYLERFIADCAMSAIEKDIEISFNPSKKEIFCNSNDYLLDILFKNIISNSIKYTNKGGKIEISTTSDADDIVIKVKDNGVGVPKENIDKIFGRFYREHNTKEDGSGLGLSIVTEIIKIHHGYIHAINNNDQTGITVIIRIPKSKD